MRRVPQRGSQDRALLDAILDEALVCHVAFAGPEGPFVIPTGFARDGDRLLLHGSTASRLMQVLASGAPVSIAVTLLDGLVLSRSAFHHSMNYRSAVMFGTAQRVPAAQTNEALRAYMERIVPGRWDQARPPNDQELAGTMVVEFPITEFACKQRWGPPADEAQDMEWPAWSGVIPLPQCPTAPQQDPTQPPQPAPPNVAAWRPDRRAMAQADRRE